jgi:hypothetical protein
MAALEDAVRRAVLDHPEVAVVYLFGSIARGEAGPTSDVDLAVLYRSRVARPVHDEVSLTLAHAVAVATRRERVDVVDLAAQGPIFGHRVLLEGRRLFVADEKRRIDFESDVVSRALDFRPTWEHATRGKPAALRRWLREDHDARRDPIEAGRHQGEPRETG